MSDLTPTPQQPCGPGPFQLVPRRGTQGELPDQLIAIAGHEFFLRVDNDISIEHADYLLRILPDTGLAPTCEGVVTSVRVRHSHELFTDRAKRLADAPATTVRVHGEHYLRTQLGGVTWWRPASQRRQGDHLYARDRAGGIHVVLRPGADRAERRFLPVLRDVALSCGEARGWAPLDAWAAAVEDHGVLILGSQSDAASVLTALAAHRQADLVASGRTLLTGHAASVVGVPTPVRIARPTLSALSPRTAIPPHRTDGDSVVSVPRDFTNAFAARVREQVPLRLVVLPRLGSGDQPLHIAAPGPAATRAALTAACRVPQGRPWLPPCFGRTLQADEPHQQAAELVSELVARVPAMALTAGLSARHALERIADAVGRRLP